MSINWTMLVVVVAAFLLALFIQSVVQKMVLDENVRRYWNESTENSIKFVRQDVTGIILTIEITNALLTAILATPILHS